MSIRRWLAKALARPEHCRHDWRYSGPTGTGWYIARCSRCGEMDLA